MALASRADDKFPDSMRTICLSVRVLRREPFVIVIVPINHDCYPRRVQVVPEGLDLWIIPVFRTRTKQRLVPIRQGADGGMLPQIRGQPLFFDGARLAPANFLALAIEHEDVPSTQFVAVEAFFRIARDGPEIIEIWSRSTGMKFVVADGWSSPRFVSPPGGIVALGELLGGAFLIGIVARRENRARNRLQELRSRLGTGYISTVCNVPGPDQNGITFARSLQRMSGAHLRNKCPDYEDHECC